MGLKNAKATVLEGTTLPQAEREKLILEHCKKARLAGHRF
jgi:hypothetical protein